MTSGVLLAVASAGAGFRGDVLQLVADSGPLVKGVLLVLLVFSVLSWAVIIDRARALRRAERESLAFLLDLQAERRLADLRDRASRYRASPLVPIFLAGFRELTSAIAEGVGKFRGNPGIPDEERARILERVRRRLEERAAAEAERLDKNLGVLATTGSVTPFIGLFGTVWGIMDAFAGIGAAGSANLGAVAPGIAEALVATALGLFAAIPAVMGYNHLLNRIKGIGTRLDLFTLEFLSMAERIVARGR